MEINKQFAHNNNTNYSVLMTNTGKFADALKRLRSWRGLSQKELGDAIGVADTTISAWENPKMDRTPVKTQIDDLVKFFKDEIADFNIDLYELAGVYSNVEITQMQRVIKNPIEKIIRSLTDDALNEVTTHLDKVQENMDRIESRIDLIYVDQKKLVDEISMKVVETISQAGAKSFQDMVDESKKLKVEVSLIYEIVKELYESLDERHPHSNITNKEILDTISDKLDSALNKGNPPK